MDASWQLKEKVHFGELSETCPNSYPKEKGRAGFFEDKVSDMSV